MGVLESVIELKRMEQSEQARRSDMLNGILGTLAQNEFKAKEAVRTADRANNLLANIETSTGNNNILGRSMEIDSHTGEKQIIREYSTNPNYALTGSGDPLIKNPLFEDAQKRANTPPTKEQIESSGQATGIEKGIGEIEKIESEKLPEKTKADTFWGIFEESPREKKLKENKESRKLAEEQIIQSVTGKIDYKKEEAQRVRNLYVPEEKDSPAIKEKKKIALQEVLKTKQIGSGNIPKSTTPNVSGFKVLGARPVGGK